MKFRKIISGAVCMAVAILSMAVPGAVVADAGSLEKVTPVNNTYFWDSITLENGLEYKVYEDYVSITGCDKSVEGEIIIPEMIEGLPVKFIEKETFKDCSSLTSVIIPSSVISIENYAFLNCSSLTSIHVDSENRNYMDIEGVLFSKDQKKLLNYPAKKSDQSYSIPDSVTSIGPSAFESCSSLTSVTISNSVTYIEIGVFDSCSSLESLVIPDSVIKIYGNALVGCSSLTSVTI